MERRVARFNNLQTYHKQNFEAHNIPETDQQIDPITYAPSLGREIENEYGRAALEGLRSIGFKFEEPVG
jgi:hypothetical protein